MGAIAVLAHYRATKQVKADLQRKGIKLSSVTARDIQILAELYLELHGPELVAQAKEMIASSPELKRMYEKEQRELRANIRKCCTKAGALFYKDNLCAEFLNEMELEMILGYARVSTDGQILVPTAPGYLGTYQLVFGHVFQLFGYSQTLGIIAATAVQVFCFGTVTILGGLVLLSRSGLTIWRAHKWVSPERS